MLKRLQPPLPWLTPICRLPGSNYTLWHFKCIRVQVYLYLLTTHLGAKGRDQHQAGPARVGAQDLLSGQKNVGMKLLILPNPGPTTSPSRPRLPTPHISSPLWGFLPGTEHSRVTSGFWLSHRHMEKVSEPRPQSVL